MSDINTRDAEKIGRLETEKKNLETVIEGLKKEKAELEVSKKTLTEDGDNKTKALNDLRSDSKEKEKLHKEEIQRILETLGVEKLEDVEQIAKNAQGFQKMQEEKQAQTLANIEKYTKQLGGEEFLKSKEALLDGLSDEKKEIYLAERVLELPKKDVPSMESVEYEEGTTQPEKSMIEIALGR